MRLVLSVRWHVVLLSIPVVEEASPRSISYYELREWKLQNTTRSLFVAEEVGIYMSWTRCYIE